MNKPILALRQVRHEDLGSLENIFRAAGLEWRYLNLLEEPAPKVFRPADWAGLVVLGGPMNVDETERYPFLADEVRWIGQALAAELPMLGICLGAQLLAKTLGAQVFANGVKEIGWYEIELLPAAWEDPLFGSCGPREMVFQWHGDTFDLPPGAVQLARGAQCQQQAFRAASSAWGLQFHLEVCSTTIDTWLGKPGNCAEIDELLYIDAAEIRGRMPDALAKMQPLMQAVLGGFVQLCREQS